MHKLGKASASSASLFLESRDREAPAPPVKLRSFNGEPIVIDLAGVTRICELRECIGNEYCVLPAAVKLTCQSVGAGDLIDGKHIAEYIRSARAQKLHIKVFFRRED